MSPPCISVGETFVFLPGGKVLYAVAFETHGLCSCLRNYLIVV